MIAVALALTLAAASADAPLARYIVVVGYNGPTTPAVDGVALARPTLTWADDDAVRLHQQLSVGAKRSWLLTSFDDDSARLWAGERISARPPTRTELAQVLGEAYWAMREEENGAELVFAIVGHGDVDEHGEGYVVLADGAFSRSDLERQVIEASPARINHVIVDACAAYHLVARGDATVPLPAELKAALQPRRLHDASVGWQRTGVLVATSSAAATHESASVGGGVFSFVLRSALTGAADENGDGRVEYGEVAAFVAAANAAVTDPRARLDITSRAPAHDPHAPVVDLSASGIEHFLFVDGGTRRLRLLDARGLPWAEVHKEPGQRTLVGLVGSPYFVVERTSDHSVEQAVVVPRARGAYALSSLRFTKSPTPRGVDPTTDAFFAIAYGSTFLQGFAADGRIVPPAPGPSFDVPFALDGEPPWRLPLAALSTSALIAAAALAAGATAAAVGNVVTLGELEAGFRQTGTLDPAASLRADSFLATFGVLGAAAVVATVAGTAFAIANATAEAP